MCVILVFYVHPQTVSMLHAFSVGLVFMFNMFLLSVLSCHTNNNNDSYDIIIIIIIITMLDAQS